MAYRILQDNELLLYHIRELRISPYSYLQNIWVYLRYNYYKMRLFFNSLLQYSSVELVKNPFVAIMTKYMFYFLIELLGLRVPVFFIASLIFVKYLPKKALVIWWS